MVIRINVLLQRRHGIFVCFNCGHAGREHIIVNTLGEDMASALGGFFLSFVFSFCGCI